MECLSPLDVFSLDFASPSYQWLKMAAVSAQR